MLSPSDKPDSSERQSEDFGAVQITFSVKWIFRPAESPVDVIVDGNSAFRLLNKSDHSFNLAPGPHTIEVQFKGWRTQTIHLDLKAGSMVRLYCDRVPLDLWITFITAILLLLSIYCNITRLNQQANWFGSFCVLFACVILLRDLRPGGKIRLIKTPKVFANGPVKTAGES